MKILHKYKTLTKTPIKTRIRFIIIILTLVIIALTSAYFLFIRLNTEREQVEENMLITKNDYKRISFEQMNTVIKDNNLDQYTILDVRSEEEYSEGRVPNSIVIPHNEIDKALNKITNKDEYIFVYCRSGMRSMVATTRMIELGYKNVYDVGGINSYRGEIEY